MAVIHKVVVACDGCGASTESTNENEAVIRDNYFTIRVGGYLMSETDRYSRIVCRTCRDKVLALFK